METIDKLMEDLLKGDNNLACSAMRDLERLSEGTGAVYAYFDTFARMLESSKTYVKNRGLALIGANAKWDTTDKIRGVLDNIIAMLSYEKPITVRWAVSCLGKIATDKPNLAPAVREALREADCSMFSESMRPLIEKDIRKVLGEG